MARGRASLWALFAAVLFFFFNTCAAWAQTAVSPTSLSFSSTALGNTTNPKNVTLKNTQTVPLTSIAASTSVDYAVQATTCGTSLAAGASCTFSIVFAPTATGTRNGMLTLTHSASNSPQTVTLTGTGVLPVLLTPTSLSFAATAVGSSSAAQSVTLKNNQSTPLTSLLVSISGDYTQTNNCASTLNGGASCKVNVTFTPKAGGTRNGFLSFSDSGVTSPQTVALTGTGTGVTINVSRTALAFGSQLINTASAAQSAIVTNTGSLGVTISSIAISAEFVQNNNCPATLNPGNSCVVAVSFAPVSTGTKAGVLTIYDNAAGAPHSVTLSGTGDSRTISVAPGALVFGNQLQNTTSAAQNVTITSTGTLGVSIFSVAISGDFTQSNNCPTTLNAGTSCVVAVSFSPLSTGAKAGTLTVNDNVTGTPQTVSLSGTGASLSAGVTPTSLTFGNQLQNTTSTAQNVTINNTGTLSLTISSITISGEFTQSNNCPATLNTGTSCVVAVTFAPQSTGTKAGTLTINDNSTGGSQMVSLSGTGASLSAGVTPTSLTFGNQLQNTTSTAQNVTLTNTGTLDVAIFSVSVSGEFTQTNNCPATLTAGNSCVVAVTFSPQSTGAKTGSLTIGDNAGSPHTVSLSGVGGSLNLNVTPASLVFGNQLQNTTSAAQNVILTNTGTLDIVISGISVSSEYTQTNSCPATLVSAASCNVAVTFAPVGAGSRAGTLTIADNATGAPQTVSLSGTGTSKTLGLSYSSLVFGDQFVGTWSPWKTVMVTNTGTLNVSITGLAVSGEFTQTNNCAGTLAPGASCAVSVSFGPTTPGPKTGLLSISDDATGAPQTISISGNAVPVTLVSVAVSPANARLLVGGMQAFIAIGTYNDGSTQDLTSSAAWSSSDATVLGMTGNLATAAAAGGAAISAQSGGLSGTATAVVTAMGSGSLAFMQSQRVGHEAIKLMDGTVLIMGGQDASGALVPQAELFDPATRQFRPTGSMERARQWFSATLLRDGRVLVTGGGTSAAEIYDPADTQFHSTGSMSVARSNSAASLLQDGRVLVTGGGSAELYDPQLGTFSSLGPMVGVRREHSSTLLQDGRVLIAGGDQSTQEGTAEIFDPVALTFTLTGSIPVNRFSHTATLLQDGRVLIAGGYGTELLATASYIYDPASGAFTQTASLATSRYQHRAVLRQDGRVMVAGGFAWWFSTGSVEIFDPATGMFTLSSELQSRRGWTAVAMLDSGDVFFTGGDTYSGNSTLPSGPTASAELYSGTTQMVAMQVAPANPQIAAGTSAWFSLVGTFSDGTTQVLTGLPEWTSSDGSVVSIDAHLGLANGNATGTATISAKLGNFSAGTTAIVP